MNIKQALKIVETSAVTGVSGAIGVLSTDNAHLTWKAVGAAGVSALVGFLYSLNRQVGVAEGAASPVTATVANVSKIIENQVNTPAAPAEVFPPAKA